MESHTDAFPDMIDIVEVLDTHASNDHSIFLNGQPTF